MAYVAVKGGTEAIEHSLQRIQYERLRHGTTCDVKALQNGLRALVDQVMSEASMYSPELAALAIKQAEGSPEEAVFLLRAFRSTLPRKHYSRTVNTEQMNIERRISSSFKDIPGGQILGPTVDYSHRLLDFELLNETPASVRQWLQAYLTSEPADDDTDLSQLPKVIDLLRREGLMADFPETDHVPDDITRKSVEFPTTRSQRLQMLTRGQTGAVTSLGYAVIRGYGALHPTVGELRVGKLPVYVDHPLATNGDEQDAYYIGEVRITEAEMLMPETTTRPDGKKILQFRLGYGACFGQNETKAIAMGILDRTLEFKASDYPTHDEEFVLYHIDSVESTGFISHLKMPHYVTFQSELDKYRKTREQAEEQQKQLEEVPV
jgi:alpha-D-ribose 1-methylphosphonate 5-triphosphate synthase subunit PhnI